MQESVRQHYRDTSGYALAAVAGLAVCAIIDAGMLVFILFHGEDSASAAKVQLIVRLLTACAFLTWFDCIYSNADALGDSPNYPRWWAIGIRDPWIIEKVVEGRACFAD